MRDRNSRRTAFLVANPSHGRCLSLCARWKSTERRESSRGLRVSTTPPAKQAAAAAGWARIMHVWISALAKLHA
eukprot:scaffold4811_cov69-Phaeocystis_antarctica.AAC.8